MMKNSIIGFILGLVFGVALVAVLISVAAPSMMILQDESKLGFEESVLAIQEAAEATGWKVPKVYRLDKSVAKDGYEVDPVAIVELCQPHHAAKLLGNDEAKIVTPMMPCRAAIYQTSDGKVIVARMNSGLISKFFGDFVADVMANAAAENEVIFSSVLSD
jgi:uncharacterized protein (DUF302 family)